MSRRRKPKCRTTRRPHRFLPGMERLEARELMAADLKITGLQFVDADSRTISGPVVGEQVHLRVEWTATD
ncbi:MAG TPA: hypothetical protein PLV92_02235, partial [Pirellulaceae bacterium]|nr:hypothetical protein [Pirellulaceae bacterium]